MRERPILMSTEMVRAILDGRKTMTRRVALPAQSTPRIAPQTMEPWILNGEQETDDHGAPCWIGTHPEYPTGEKWFSCPFGKAGDTLWVREAWAVDAPLNQVRREHEDVMRGIGNGPYYRADKVHENSGLVWRPSIHMPRWASRLTLEITAVRVERVQAITEADALAEGMYRYLPRPDGPKDPSTGLLIPLYHHTSREQATKHTAREAFADVWDALNAKRGFGWDANPFCWVIGFTSGRAGSPTAS